MEEPQLRKIDVDRPVLKTTGLPFAPERELQPQLMPMLPYPSVNPLLLCNGLGAGTKAEFYLSWQPWLMQLNHRLVRAAPISNPTVARSAPSANRRTRETSSLFYQDFYFRSSKDSVVSSCVKFAVDVLGGPITPAAFDLRQGSLCARESEIVSLLLRESFHRGRVSMEMIKGEVCLPMIPRMPSVSEAANHPVKWHIPLN
ncbi:unnamed protein product [Cyprideis torosa]|uniref:Uncharacterized protein n=1 Tax=Cyprideis torosa TaxID=163714 RepID=A0A7R8WDJ7_9CRUS|nr:unnamed protein product [Cyprideis torosa]CAG0894716.1 unnamed protein product [Cyprideis torosa]